MNGRIPRYKTGLVAVLLLVLSACGGGGVPSDATGEEIYVQVCARCHGEDLRGGTGLPLVGEDARSIDKPERYFVQSISAGIGRMPSFPRNPERRTDPACSPLRHGTAGEVVAGDQLPVVSDG